MAIAPQQVQPQQPHFLDQLGRLIGRILRVGNRWARWFLTIVVLYPIVITAIATLGVKTTSPGGTIDFGVKEFLLPLVNLAFVVAGLLFLWRSRVGRQPLLFAIVGYLGFGGVFRLVAGAIGLNVLITVYMALVPVRSNPFLGYVMLLIFTAVIMFSLSTTRGTPWHQVTAVFNRGLIVLGVIITAILFALWAGISLPSFGQLAAQPQQQAPAAQPATYSSGNALTVTIPASGSTDPLNPQVPGGWYYQFAGPSSARAIFADGTTWRFNECVGTRSVRGVRFSGPPGDTVTTTWSPNPYSPGCP